MANVENAASVVAAANAGDEEMVKVTTNEGKEFTVKKKILKMFGMIKDMLAALGDDVDEKDNIPLPQVRGEIFEKILDWCEWHQDDPEPAEEESDDEDRDRRIVDIPQWNTEFKGKLSQSDIFEMMLACNYLHLPYLLELLAKTIAGKMRGKSVEAIRAEFGIENDYSAEEDRRLKKENQWAEEAVLKK